MVRSHRFRPSSRLQVRGSAPGRFAAADRPARRRHDPGRWGATLAALLPWLAMACGPTGLLGAADATDTTQAPDVESPALRLPPELAELLADMTLEEKLAQLVIDRSTDTPQEVCDKWGGHGLGAIGRPGLQRTPRETAEYVNGVQTCMQNDTRLGIPLLVVDEALHGHMSYGSTSFPQAIALGATFDPELVEEAFAVAAKEGRARGSNWVLTPVLDLARDPRWGRTDETYGEDPYLVSRLGVAAIRGLQGDQRPLAPDRLLATAKHFAVHGQPESGSNGGPGSFGPRVLREELLPPFEAAVREADARTLMVSYTDIDGVPAHVNRWLLTELLREQWGYDGLIISDGGAIGQLVFEHHVASTPVEAARLAMEAGIQFELGRTFVDLEEEIESGRLSEAVIDAAVAQVLLSKYELGLFEQRMVDPSVADERTNDADAQALALRAANEAIVLLKNDAEALPLDHTALRSVAVVGPNAAKAHLGSYSVDPGRAISVLEGIKRRVPDLSVAYAQGCRITEDDLTWEGWWKDEVTLADPSQDDALLDEAVALAQRSDVAIVVVGEHEATSREGWSADHLGDRDSLELLGRQNELVRRIHATGTPTIVVLVNGRPLAIEPVLESADAVLEGFYLGQETGLAVADVLFGRVNPSGRLPVSLPRSVGQLPVYYYHRPSARRGYLFRDDAPVFPFGYGLSYTTFEYDPPKLSREVIAAGDSVQVTVRVRNTGARSGDEVVQLYVHDQVASVTRPVKLLRGFQRIRLDSGAETDVTFTVGPPDLQLYDRSMHAVVEPGVFELQVGPNSVDTQTVLLRVR